LALLALLARPSCGGRTADGQDPPRLVPSAGSLGAACLVASLPAERYPLALLLLVDQSVSMSDPVAGGTKWSVATSAVKGFVASPGLDRLGVGVQYFGLPSGQPSGQAFLDSCDPADYARPDVAIGPLSANAAAVASSLDAHGPSSGTPTDPALKGAADYVMGWANATPGVVPAVAVVTDGEPYGCGSSVAGTAAIAAGAATAQPPVLTFVIGLGSSLDSLNAIAKAGGTDHAYLVDTTGRVSDQIRGALDDLRRRVPCAYAIPSIDAGVFDFDKVNVTFGARGDAGTQALVGQVSGRSACTTTEQGWYYEPPDAPQSIQLCPTTCQAISGDTEGTLTVALGCRTVVAPNQ
jgi:hypothetical protein